MALHSGNKKQNVPWGLAIFHETTIAAFKSYFLERKVVADFLTLINSCWTVVNARTQFTFNLLANAPVQGDGNGDFVPFFFANRFEKWSHTSGNTFSFWKQTSDALVRTLHAQSCLITDLHGEGFIFVIPRRFQSDPLENCFAEYRQKSGGRFLGSLLCIKSSLQRKVC